MPPPEFSHRTLGAVEYLTCQGLRRVRVFFILTSSLLLLYSSPSDNLLHLLLIGSESFVLPRRPGNIKHHIALTSCLQYVQCGCVVLSSPPDLKKLDIGSFE